MMIHEQLKKNVKDRDLRLEKKPQCILSRPFIHLLLVHNHRTSSGSHARFVHARTSGAWVFFNLLQ